MFFCRTLTAQVSCVMLVLSFKSGRHHRGMSPNSTASPPMIVHSSI
jgi:hypothetical protein